jgi:dienelactone hydrolase
MPEYRMRVGKSSTSWAAIGIATLADAGRISPVSRVVDAYRALDLLAKHPLVDANKIAVMGFSHGGGPALYSSLVRFQQMYGKPDVRFAAHVSVYGTAGRRSSRTRFLLNGRYSSCMGPPTTGCRSDRAVNILRG